MKIGNRTLAVAGVTVGLMLLGLVPGSAAKRRIIRAPVSRPLVRPAGIAQGHPHLDAALHALLLADAVMHSSVRPDVSRVMRGLTFASVELKRAPPTFLGHRAQALKDIEGAAKALRQRPPSGTAVALTEQAIQQVRMCYQSHR